MELIVESTAEPATGRTSGKAVRVHIKNETVFTFRHPEGDLIGQLALSEFFPKPRPSFVDSMFFYAGHLNLLSGRHIYSYLFDFRSGRCTKFKNLHFKFRLPAHVEAAFCVGNSVFFTKENRFYVFDLTGSYGKAGERFAEQSIGKANEDRNGDNSTEDGSERKNGTNERNAGPFRIVGELLTNCSRKTVGQVVDKANDYLRPEVGLVQSFDCHSVPFDNYRRNYPRITALRNNRIEIVYIVLTGLFVFTLIILLVGVFIYLEFYSNRKRRFFSNSLKQRRLGIVLEASSKSFSNRQLYELLEKNRKRCVSDSVEQAVKPPSSPKISWRDGLQENRKRSLKVDKINTKVRKASQKKSFRDADRDFSDEKRNSLKDCCNDGLQSRLSSL